MKVSIIIPAFNEEKYIEQTLKCALKQDYSDFEIIVIDNNSTDRTNEIAKSLGVKVFFEKNKGTGWARERGRREASGEVLAFLDADCLPSTDWLSKGVKHFEHNKKVVAVSGPYDYFDSQKWYRFFSFLIQKYIYTSFNFLLQKLNKGAVIIFGNCFVKASSLDDIGGLDTSIVFYGDDTDLAKRISKKGEVFFDDHLIMKGSSRRLKREGIFKVPLIYIFYFFKVSSKR